MNSTRIPHRASHLDRFSGARDPAMRYSLLAVAALALGACATAPKPAPAPPPAPVVEAPPKHEHAGEFRTAYDHYTQGRQAAALELFDHVLADATSDAGERRAAHLGKALVYLSADKQFRNPKSARTEAQAANELGAGESDIGALTGFLQSAVEASLAGDGGTAELNARVAKLTKDKAALEAERTALLAEQEKLKAAIEKLKKVTLEK